MPSTPLCILTTPLRTLLSDQSSELFDTAAKAGIDSLLIEAGAELPSDIIERCRSKALRIIVTLDLTEFSIGDALVQSHPEAFGTRRGSTSRDTIDPRIDAPETGLARARLRSPEVFKLLRDPLRDRMVDQLKRGISGFRLTRADRVEPSFLKTLIVDVRTITSDAIFIAGSPDLSRPQAKAMKSVGLDYLVSSFAWWDLKAPWLIEEYEDLRRIAALLSEVSLTRPNQADDTSGIARRLSAAAAVGDGMIMPAALLKSGADLGGAVSQAIAIAHQVADCKGEMRRLSETSAPVTALLRCDAPDVRDTTRAIIVLINTSGQPQPAPPAATLLQSAGTALQLREADMATPLNAGEVRVLSATRTRSIESPRLSQPRIEEARLVMEAVTPRVEGGAFPVKRVVGDVVAVGATIYADGHEQLAAVLQWRAIDEDKWQSVRMKQLPNDGWEAAFSLERLGRYEFVIEAWLDRFGGFRRDFAKKLDAGVAQTVDHAEGRALVDEAAGRAGKGQKTKLKDWSKRIAGANAAGSATLLLSAELAALMDVCDDSPHLLRSAVQSVDAERMQARYSSWYELFPRSQGGDRSRHGTFADVIERLPAVRDMGFDTLYFPPIHPIGTTNRKGPNNTLTPVPGDPGSPYAIGSEDGGHDAIHPELGGFEDFAKLVQAAHGHGLEIAIDFAIQCSPDHPWLKDHPGWFAWRPDGSIKYAENPPKKYQDIVNVDFYGPGAVPALWEALRDVVLLWIEHGVTTFRVDNPHTKPLPFWEWMIGDVRAKHPEAIFLAEAFTRPAMMYRLAKIGFSQSYTYFTWRDGKAELTNYVNELTNTAPKEFYRPHLFVNTPDINPLYLQTSGRPGFRIRAVLAATLSGLFGVYSGFELCESTPVPGKEEYLDSEKYELRPRDWNAPGNIIADITLLNRLRRAHPALQTHLNTRFLVAHNEQIIYYAKPSPSGCEMLLVMVNLDPHQAQEAAFEVPLWEFGLPDDATIAVEDLVGGNQFRWRGKTQHIRIDPSEPYHIWRIAAGGGV